MTYDTALAVAGSLALASFHPLSKLLRFLPGGWVDNLRSAAGGAGLAYVFLYLLFELTAEGAARIHALMPIGPAPLETLFIFLLAALCGTYLLQMELERTPDTYDDHRGFIALFVAYNVLAGAAVVDEARWGALNLTFYVVAIGVHLLFNEAFLGHRFPADHTRFWQAVVGLAPVLGCAIAIGAGIPAGVHYAVLAVVAGGTITIVFQRELPGSRQIKSFAFIAGVVAYAGLIFAFWRF